MRTFIAVVSAFLIIRGSPPQAAPADTVSSSHGRLQIFPAVQSVVLPGLGQATQGHWKRAGVILAGEAFLAGDAVYHWELQYDLSGDDTAGRTFYRDVAYGLSAWYALGAAFSALDALYGEPPAGAGNPTLSVFQSLLFPGWGQLANGRHWKAAGMFVLQTSLGFAAYYQHQNYLYYLARGEEKSADFYRDDRNRLIWWSLGALIFSAADAYVDAHLRTWDISDDLSLAPTVIISRTGKGFVPGLSLTYLP